MPNEKNLKPVRTKEEARKRGANGGKKSGEVRRRNKALRETLIEINNLPINDSEERERLLNVGFDSGDITHGTKMAFAMVEAAEAGNVAAFKTIAELTEEKDGAVQEEEDDNLYEAIKAAVKGLANES
jgi:hypothetical protein